MTAPITLAELVRNIVFPIDSNDFSCFRKQPYLFADLRASDAAHPDQLPALMAALNFLECPKIALCNQSQITTSSPLTQAFDVLVDTPEAAQPVLKNISRFPQSALILIQLLRHNERSSLEDGLLAESLAYATLQSGSEHKGVNLHQFYEPNSASEDDETEAVKVSRAGQNLSIVFNRPQRRNAFSIALRDGLRQALQLLVVDDSLVKATVSGAGACFCTGGDLEEFGQVRDGARAHQIRSGIKLSQLLIACSKRLEFRLHSACIGAGIEIPAFGAHIVANKNTFIQLPEITLGLIPGAGGTVSITRRIGRQRTAYLALSGKRIRASTALEWGLIDAIE